MRFFHKFLLCNSFFVLFLFNSVWAANTSYYVDATNGSNSNTGLSHAQAWKTLSKINSSSFSSGDNVYLLCGETFTGASLTIDWSGTEGDNAVLGAYYMNGGVETVGVNGDGKPIIDGEDIYPTLQTSGLIKINKGEDYVTVQDIEVQNSNGHGILGETNSSYVTVQRCKVDTTYKPNITMYYSNHSTITENECAHGAQERLPGATAWPGGGIITRYSSYATVTKNYIYEQKGEGIGLGNYDTAMYNLVVDCMSNHIYIDGRSNVKVAYNLIIGTNDTTYENPNISGWHSYGIVTGIESNGGGNSQNNDIHNNVVINTAACWRVFDQNATYSLGNDNFYNNTCIDNRETIIALNPGDVIDLSTIRLKNNISFFSSGLHETTVTSSTLDNWDCDYNIWTSTPSQSVFRGAHDKIGDPNFVKSKWRDSNLTLNSFSFSDCFVKSGSLAINSGVDLGSKYSKSLGNGTDFSVPITINLLTQDNTSWDIGATILDNNANILPPSGLKITASQ